MSILVPWLRRLALAVVLATLGACASPPTPAPAPLHDELFAPPAEAVSAHAVFALNEPMQRFADAQLGRLGPGRDPRRALLDALYRPDRLRLAYDAGRTRNAAEAFDARAGNCLSLVIMTAAFARHLGLPVQFQSVAVDDGVTRSGDLLFVAGHVNLVLGRVPSVLRGGPIDDSLVVDFLPAEELRGQRTRPLDERTVVAMYFNNRAAESLADGRTAESYWWAREAVLRAPDFAAARNTLAVVYLRAGHLEPAERLLRQLLDRDGDNPSALGNLARLLERAGRDVEAAAARRRLAAVQPFPPLHFLDLGRRALQAGDAQSARVQFERELQRQPYQSEVHFWMAQALLRLGDHRAAARHLELARDNGPTVDARALYAAKLDRLLGLRGLHVQ